MKVQDKQTIALAGIALIVWFLLKNNLIGRTGALDTTFNTIITNNNSLAIFIGIIMITGLVLWAFHESKEDKAIKLKRWGLL